MSEDALRHEADYFGIKLGEKEVQQEDTLPAQLLKMVINTARTAAQAILQQVTDAVRSPLAMSSTKILQYSGGRSDARLEIQCKDVDAKALAAYEYLQTVVNQLLQKHGIKVEFTRARYHGSSLSPDTVTASCTVSLPSPTDVTTWPELSSSEAL